MPPYMHPLAHDLPPSLSNPEQDQACLPPKLQGLVDRVSAADWGAIQAWI